MKANAAYPAGTTPRAGTALPIGGVALRAAKEVVPGGGRQVREPRSGDGEQSGDQEQCGVSRCGAAAKLPQG
jgi:hypothetical protein